MRWIVLCLLAAAVAAGIWVARRDGAAPRTGVEPAAPPGQVETGVARDAGPPEFVGSQRCRACHEERYETWLKTAHAYSLRSPREGTVEAPFDGKPITTPHFVATPYRDGKEFRIRVEGRDGRPSGDYRVTHVVGRSFEQAYLLTGPRGEWRVLPVCWSIERGEWDLTHEVLDDITGSIGSIPDDYDTRNHVFNHGCGQCHATNYDVGYELNEETGGGIYASHYLEGAVACESCHGPGSAHAAYWKGRDEPGPDYAAPQRLLHPAKDLDSKQVLESCGRCHYLHEWRYAIDADPRVPYGDIAVSMNWDGTGFFADGRLAGLNYHGSTQRQSPCYLKGGMSCLSCHSMHSGKKFAMKWPGRSDTQCSQCHAEQADAGKKHTFHAEDADLRCVDCHMPRFVKGPLHFLRDHRIRSPEPELTERFGADSVPNACNLCHDDRTATWARGKKEEWYGTQAPSRLVADVAQVVALRRDAAKVETAELVATAERASSELFFRLTALRALGDRPRDEQARRAVRGRLADPDPEIVLLACEILGKNPDPQAAATLLRLVEYPVRTVRVSAAYALSRAGFRGTSEALDRVWKDAVAMLDRQRPLPDTVLRIGMIADAIARPMDLEKYFRLLIRLAGSNQWSPAAVEFMHRRARWLTENLTHEDAIISYAQVRGLIDGPLPLLLYFDSADSLEAAGRVEEAINNWRTALPLTKEGSVLRAVAEARLAMHTEGADLAPHLERLESLADELKDDPAAGQLLIRVRWSITALRERR